MIRLLATTLLLVPAAFLGIPAMVTAQVFETDLNSQHGSHGVQQMQVQLPRQEAAAPVEHFSAQTAHASSRSQFATSGYMSGLGYGSMSTYRSGTDDNLGLELTSGFLAVRQQATSNLQGGGVFASVIPVFLGLRHDFAEMKSRRMRWTQYIVVGGGPLVGIEYPQSYSFFNALGRLGFRWGAGAYAGIGSEMRLNDGIGFYAQLELTGMGFTAPLVDRTSYLGPSFAFGMQFYPSM